MVLVRQDYYTLKAGEYYFIDQDQYTVTLWDDEDYDSSEMYELTYEEAERLIG